MTYGCLRLLASNNFATKISNHIERFLKKKHFENYAKFDSCYKMQSQKPKP